MSPVSDSQTIKTVIMEDSVIAVGSPDAKNRQIDNEKDLVFVGLKYSYIVKSGSDILKKILSSLDGGNYIGINNNETVEFEIDEDGFHGSLDIYYLKELERYSNKERTIIKDLEFCLCPKTKNNLYQEKQIYSKHVIIKGTIYPKAGNLNDIKSKFKKSRLVRFISKKTETTVNSKDIVYKIFMLPVALTFDVITFPFQIIGIGAMK